MPTMTSTTTTRATTTATETTQATRHEAFGPSNSMCTDGLMDIILRFSLFLLLTFGGPEKRGKPKHMSGTLRGSSLVWSHAHQECGSCGRAKVYESDDQRGGEDQECGQPRSCDADEGYTSHPNEHAFLLRQSLDLDGNAVGRQQLKPRLAGGGTVFDGLCCWSTFKRREIC